MPTILQINVTANWGSTGKIAEQIGQCAMKHGWNSYIAYGRWCNSSESHLIKVGNFLDILCHYGVQKIRDNEGLCSCIATKFLVKKIKEINPSIIHLHNIHDHYLNYKILFEYLNSTDIKVVWTFHDCWAITGHCFHFVSRNCERWKSICYKCPLQHEYPKTMLDRSKKNYLLKKYLFTNNKNLTIVACSEWIGNLVSKSFLKDKPIYVIHNGIDLKVFRNSKNLIDNNQKEMYRILAVSNVWNKDKGYDDIINLRKLLPDDCEISIIGVTKKQQDDLPLGIMGIQRTQNVNDMVKLYSNADVLINPTYADTFPTVNLEALACGTPVVTYRTGGSPEAIDRKTGIVVEQGDINGLAEAILQLRKKPLSSTDCRKRVEEFFDKDKCYSSYIRLYENLCGIK